VACAESAPYLSVVTVMRNDDYGGHLLHRFHRSIQTLGELALKHALTVELVVVEWNPPPDTPRLRDALLWPDSLLDVLIVAPARPPALPPARPPARVGPGALSRCGGAGRSRCQQRRTRASGRRASGSTRPRT
jgi:hypothetical protein